MACPIPYGGHNKKKTKDKSQYSLEEMAHVIVCGVNPEGGKKVYGEKDLRLL